MLKILAIRACAVGDFVVNLPALQALQNSDTHARFTLVGYPSTLEIAREFVSVEAIHSIDTDPWRRIFHEPMPELDFDRAIVWMKDPSVADNLRRSGVAQVLHAPPFPKSGHAAKHLLESVGLPEPSLPDLWRPESDRIILHPGSGSPKKNWLHFRELAERLQSVAFLIGPAEEGFDSGSYPRLENLSLREVARVACTSRGFVGNDSGVTHLAAYLGCPTIAIFVSTDPSIWGPIGRRVQIVRNLEVNDLLRMRFARH